MDQAGTPGFPTGDSSHVFAQPLSIQHLPGSPRVSLDAEAVESYAESELTTPELDHYQHLNLLWLVATPSRRHVSSLTHQAVRGRNIIVTEHARLHCVWINDRIFIKPVPRWLLSANIWRHYFESPIVLGPRRREQILRAARGFLATYALLVTHESDFEIAREKRLVPANMKWEPFCAFVDLFAGMADDDLNPRYHYGDLRLSRLNLLAPVAIGKLNYHKVYGRSTASEILFAGLRSSTLAATKRKPFSSHRHRHFH